MLFLYNCEKANEILAKNLKYLYRNNTRKYNVNDRSNRNARAIKTI